MLHHRNYVKKPQEKAGLSWLLRELLAPARSAGFLFQNDCHVEKQPRDSGRKNRFPKAHPVPAAIWNYQVLMGLLIAGDGAEVSPVSEGSG